MTMVATTSSGRIIRIYGRVWKRVFILYERTTAVSARGNFFSAIKRRFQKSENRARWDAEMVERFIDLSGEKMCIYIVCVSNNGIKGVHYYR